MNFTCSLSHVNDVVTVTPVGDIDLAGTTELREALQSAVRNQGVTRVVVDLAGVTFIDSTVLGVLIAAHTAAERRGAVLVVTNPGAMVTMVLNVTGLFDVLVDPATASQPAASQSAAEEAVSPG